MTRRKNQVQQLFSVTNPELKRAFKKTGALSVLKLALKYPTAQEMAKATQDELRQTLIAIGAKSAATKASMTLAELLPNTLAFNVPHLAERQTWLIEEALRIDEAIKSMDKQIASLLYGDQEKGHKPHPYIKIKIAQVLYSCLKNNKPYDPFKHASKMGVTLEADKVRLKIPANLDDFELQADELADDEDV